MNGNYSYDSYCVDDHPPGTSGHRGGAPCLAPYGAWHPGEEEKPNFDLLRALIFYIDAYPGRLHHPKESDHLFKHLRARSDEAGELLDKLDSIIRAENSKFSAWSINCWNTKCSAPAGLRRSRMA